MEKPFGFESKVEYSRSQYETAGKIFGCVYAASIGRGEHPNTALTHAQAAVKEFNKMMTGQFNALPM